MGYFDQIQSGHPLPEELSGDPVGMPPHMMRHGDLEIGEIPRFVNDSINQIARLGKLYEIDEVSFCLKLGCNEVEFMVKIKKDSPMA